MFIPLPQMSFFWVPSNSTCNANIVVIIVMCQFCLACFFFCLSKGSWQNCKLFQFPFPSFWVQKVEPPVEEVAGSWWRAEISSFPLKPRNDCLLGSNDTGTIKSWVPLKSTSASMTDFQESKQQFLSYSLFIFYHFQIQKFLCLAWFHSARYLQ